MAVNRGLSNTQSTKQPPLGPFAIVSERILLITDQFPNMKWEYTQIFVNVLGSVGTAELEMWSLVSFALPQSQFESVK